jgi:GT2 family glycosyltransferase
MTVHNRRAETLACLRSLHRQGGDRVALTTYVVDDGSTDGTGAAVRSEFPEVRLLQGDGDLFWNGGMRKAFGAALAEGFDAYWWLNDDVELDADALEVLLATADELASRGAGPAIVVGAMRDPDDGHTTYGGRRRSRLRPLDFWVVEPSGAPEPVDTMNGNCVLIPSGVAHLVGTIDPAYRQKMGDFDYGLRAQEAGFGVWLAPRALGTCASHPPRRTVDKPLVEEVRRLWSVKELPPHAWKVFVRRWAGPLWPVFWLSPYVKRTAALLAERVRRP